MTLPEVCFFCREKIRRTAIPAVDGVMWNAYCGCGTGSAKLFAGDGRQAAEDCRSKLARDNRRHREEQRLFSMGLLKICERLHMSETGTAELLPDDERQSLFEYLLYRLEHWKPSNLKNQRYDEAVRALVVLVVVTDKSIKPPKLPLPQKCIFCGSLIRREHVGAIYAASCDCSRGSVVMYASDGARYAEGQRDALARLLMQQRAKEGEEGGEL